MSIFVAITHTGTSSAEKRFPLSCCVASTAFSSEGYVTCTSINKFRV
jgi:hypothetical protein